MKKFFKYLFIVLCGIVALPIVLLVAFITYSCISAYCFEHQFESRRSISRITCVEFPSFHVVEKIRIKSKLYKGDSNYEVKAQFDELPDDAFFEAVADRFKITDVKGKYGNYSSWREEDEKICYNRTWGNGEPAPPTQDENEDVFLSIKIEKGAKDFTISYGRLRGF